MQSRAPEPNVTSAPAAQSASPHFRLRWRPLGNKIRVGMYAGPDRFVTHAYLGGLTFESAEWEAFRAIVGAQVEVMHWDDPLPMPPA